MSLLLDLPDERRKAKTWLPESDKDVTEHRVIKGDTCWDGKPECVLHGSMNCIAPKGQDESRLFRCSQCGVGAIWYPTNSQVARKRFREEWDAAVRIVNS